MALPLTLKQRLQRKVPRVVKASRHWMRVVADRRFPDTRVVFVVGSQRSGTRLPLQIMDCSPYIATYSEGSHPYFSNVLLQPLDRIEWLVRRSPSPIIALKPICETHRIIELLNRFPRSSAVWIFRDFRDVVNSASIKWKSGREAVRRLAAGELKAAGWRAGGITDMKLGLVKRLYRDDMSLHEANALMWYLRNSLFFDLHVNTRPDVILVRYEDLVVDPTAHSARVFDFIGVPLPERIAEAVHSSPPSKPSFPEIYSEIRELCEALQQRLIAFYSDRIKKKSAPMGAHP